MIRTNNMMRNATLLFVLLGCCCGFGFVGAYGSDNLLRGSGQQLQNGENNDVDGPENGERILSTNMMMPGERVSAMDRNSAICSADFDSGDQEIAIERTTISYYYAIESTEKITTDDSAGRSMIRTLEDKLFRAIRPAILWCYFDLSLLTRRNLVDGSGPSSVQADEFHGDSSRKLTLEEARRLSIVSFSTNPKDEEKSDIDCNFPTNGGNCTVMHGMVTIMHHVTSDVSLAAASIYDSTQKAMDYSELFMAIEEDENYANITNIEWLGETEQDAIIGGPNGNGVIVIGAPPSVSEINVEVLKQEEEEKSLLAYALTVPLLIIMALALLLVRNKTSRKIRTKEQLRAVGSFDNVFLIGTGDPPNSFHEGMYHYTRNGVRYLSTNCAECIKTKESGFFTAGDLETIDEDVRSLDDDSADRRDQSGHRRKFLVFPSDTALGKKHSSIDVHHCHSARCSFCTYKPRDVEFISKSDEDFVCLRVGESEV